MEIIIVTVIISFLGHLLTKVLLRHLNPSSDAKPQQLYYAKGIWIMGMTCLAFICWVAVEIYIKHTEEPSTEAFWLISIMGPISLYLVVEGLLVKGSFNDNEIRIFTPWTGIKHEQWQDLHKSEFNPYAMWYVLTFNSGKTIRLSPYLNGLTELTALLESKGIRL